MDVDDLRVQVQASIRRFIASVVLHNLAVAQHVGLGASDSQFVSLLDLQGPLTPGRLAELTGLTTGTVTGVIDRLERGGYVRRTRDAADRRKVLVTLVPDGMAGLAAHYREHGEHLAAALDRRDDAQLRVIADFLAELTDTGSGTASPEPG